MKTYIIAKLAQLLLDILYHLYENKMVANPGLKLIHETVLHNAVFPSTEIDSGTSKDPKQLGSRS